ncbi:2-keto-3-deoxy-L-fuconate dehydrogenase [compost metagenome]
MAELDRLFDRVRLEIGRIDVLFVNAGGGSLLPLGKITEEHYDTAASGGTEAFSVYAASKAAVRSFARNWILDLEGRGIRVNTLSPGPTKTPGFFGLAGPDAARQQRMLDALASRIPMGRVGDPDEIAKAAVFLASDDSSFVNGIELFVEGGKAQI